MTTAGQALMGVGLVVGLVQLAKAAGQTRVDVDKLAAATADMTRAQKAELEQSLLVAAGWGKLDDIVTQTASSNIEAARRLIGVAESAGITGERLAALKSIVDEEARAQVQASIDGEKNAEALTAGAEGADAQADALEGLVDAIDALLGKYFSIEEAQDSFQTGLNELAGNLRTLREEGLNYADALTSTTDAAIGFREEMRGIVEDGAAVIQRMVEQGKTSDEINAKIDSLSQAFRVQAEAAGVPGPVVEHYLGILAAIPTQKSTTVNVDTDEAERKIGRLQGLLNSLNSRVDNASSLVSGAAKAAAKTPGQKRAQSSGGWAGTGKLVSGPFGVDTIPTYLAKGEFVLPKHVADRLGAGPLMALLRGASLADLVGAIANPIGVGMPTAISSTSGQVAMGGSTVVNVPISISGVIGNERELAQRLHGVVKAAIVTAERHNGKLPLVGR